MFKNFDDKDFARVMLVNEMKDLSMLEVVENLEEKYIPLSIVSSFINIKRFDYDLPRNSHKDYQEVKDDAVVSQKGYNESHDLKLVLLSLLVESRFTERLGNGKLRLDLSKVIRTIRSASKFLSVGNKHVYDTKGYIDYIKEEYVK